MKQAWRCYPYSWDDDKPEIVFGDPHHTRNNYARITAIAFVVLEDCDPAKL